MRVTVSAVVATFVVGFGPLAVLAQTAADRTIEQFTCKDIMRESGPHRDVAIAFLHGYLVGKSGTSKFNLETLTKQSNAFIEQCLDNPNAKAEDIMAKFKG